MTAVDRDAQAMRGLRERGGLDDVVVADLESGPWPFAGRRFGAVVAANYLWRPLLPRLVEALDDDGVLVYETFAAGQETVGPPSRPDFLLRRGELLTALEGLSIVAFQDGFLPDPDRFVQRVVAVRERPSPAPRRWRLDARPAGPGSVESSDSGMHE